MKSDTFTHAANLHSLLDAAVSQKWRTIARHAIHARLSLPLTLIFRQDSIDICSVCILDHLEAVEAFKVYRAMNIHGAAIWQAIR